MSYKTFTSKNPRVSGDRWGFEVVRAVDSAIVRLSESECFIVSLELFISSLASTVYVRDEVIISQTVKNIK